MRLLLTIFILLSPLLANGKPTGPVARLALPSEPGTRLIVKGQVLDPSGKRPVAGVIVYAYHTDAAGRYNKPGLREPRLKGWVKTDAQGKFELRTIRPGSYPGGTNPAHIHFEAWGAGYPKQWPDALEFTDDAHVTPKMLAASHAKGKFAPIVTPSRDARGVLHVTIHMRLRNESSH